MTDTTTDQTPTTHRHAGRPHDGAARLRVGPMSVPCRTVMTVLICENDLMDQKGGKQP